MNLSGALDWDFFWGVFGMIFKLAAPFLLIIVAIYGVSKLLAGVIAAVKGRGSS